MKRYFRYLAIFSAFFYAEPLHVQTLVQVHLEAEKEIIQLDTLVREFLREALPEDEWSAIDEIVLEVPHTISFVAQARPGRVIISTGTLIITKELTYSVIAENNGREGCFFDYVSYLAYIARGELNTIRERGLPDGILSVSGFGSAENNGCSGFMTEELFTPVDWESVSLIVESSMMFLLLHEYAHHILRHLEVSIEGDLEKSRRLEAEADAWAVRIAHEHGFETAFTAGPLFTFMSITGADSLSSERFSTHPMGLRRLFDVTNVAIDISERQGKKELADLMRQNIVVLEGYFDRAE